jgi:nucleoside-triphosphatase THEP1
VAAAAREVGLIVAGMVTEDATDDGTRRVTDLRTGEKRRFGEQAKNGAGPETARPAGSDPLTPSWMYDEGVFAWGNNVLARSTPCDLLVIDELGPLEILGDRGWFTAFEVIHRRHFGTALVVCRPTLVTDLQKRIGGRSTVVYEVTVDRRETLPAVVLSEILI